MDKVTAELCQSVIDHCHAWINQFIRSDDADSLSEFKDLAELMQADLKNIEIDNTSTTDDQESEQMSYLYSAYTITSIVRQSMHNLI